MLLLLFFGWQRLLQQEFIAKRLQPAIGHSERKEIESRSLNIVAPLNQIGTKIEFKVK